MAGVLGGEQQDGSCLAGGEAAQAGDACGDRDGEVEREEGLAALGLAADDADRLAPPQRVDEPPLAARAVFELGRVRVGKPFAAVASAPVPLMA